MNLILFYLICGLIYMLVIDYISRLMIKDHTKELKLRPFKFSYLHAYLILCWPIRVVQDVVDEIKFRLR